MSSEHQISQERKSYLIDVVKEMGPESMKEISSASSATGNNNNELEVSVLSGGITNELFRIKNPFNGVSVVVRIYGKETDRLISRDAEQFFQTKFLLTFGRCEKGGALVYEFLDGMRALEPDDLPQHSQLVAETLADFHVRATTYALVTSPYCSEELHSINITTTWLEVATQAVETVPRLDSLKPDLAQLKSGCSWLRKLLEKSKNILPIVICHNDLLSGNVMVLRENSSTSTSSAGKQQPKMRFIDFEYARKDFALFDVANHWNEWAGYNNDFNKYPTLEQQQDFLRNYFSEIANLTSASESEKQKMLNDENISKAIISANFLSLASNLAWAVWSLVQHAYSVIEFDYLSYHKLKLKRFLDTREKFAEEFVVKILKEDYENRPEQSSDTELGREH